MTARLYQRTSWQAKWSRRVALFAIQLLILDVLLHRFGSLPTPAAIYIMGVAILLAVAALLLATWAFVGIWQHGIRGSGRAIGGVVTALLVMAGPLWFLPKLIMQPRINDIATNPESAPAFVVLASQRSDSANPASYPGAYVAWQQMRAYPDVRPMVIERATNEVFHMVHKAAERLGWEIVSATAPEGEAAGRIEAVAYTLVMGFADDVVIEVTPAGGESRIDVRSASRYGNHDFGANAHRIARLFDEVKAVLEKGEKTALEVALARRARETQERERKAREKARKEAQEQARLEEARLRAIREEERKQLQLLQAEQARTQAEIESQLGLAPARPVVRDAPRPRVRRRGRGGVPDLYRHLQQFGG